VENKLVTLLDFDRLRLIKELLRNRTKIVWCIRLQRARDADESARIEVRAPHHAWLGS
jgi:pre-mRNA-splicing helicase BRR2